MSYPTKVKWGKESIDLNIEVDAGVKGYKAALEELTGVPSDRMKLMPKSKGLWKGVLKDDFNLATIDFLSALTKNNPLQVLLMGSASTIVKPKTKTVFIEDLPEDEAAKHVVEPSGLLNLGNTCYLNSVLQCLRRVPHFRRALESYHPSGNQNPNAMVLSAMKDLFGRMDRTAKPVSPSTFVAVTKIRFPQFNQTGPGGAPMQQDAEEFYSGLVTSGAEELRGDAIVKSGFGSSRGLEQVDNLMDGIFSVKMEETLTCDELMDDSENKEKQVKSHDLLRKLVCNIQGGSDGNSQNINVTHLSEGIHLSLQGKIEKHSDVLGRNAMWTRKQRISQLPPVVVVQFGRFYWKATPDSQDHAGVKCKVMKPVAFNDTMDVYEFCTEKVQQSLKVWRDKAAKEEEDRVEKKLKGDDGDNKMEVDDETQKQVSEMAGNDEEAEELKAALAMSVAVEEPVTEVVGPGLPDQFQGIYELFAVVTHKGRDADGGHYMGWVKSDDSPPKSDKMDTKEGETIDENDDWFVFDDDEVSPCKTEDVLKLKGGGDWHMSYLNFYRAKK